MIKDVQSRTGTMDSRAVNLMIKDISVGDIQVKENIRKEYTGIEELQASIREYGLLQPITVYRESNDYFVKSGHRRFKASQALYQEDPDKYHSIRCIVSDAEHIAVVQLVENIQRVDLSQIDLFNAFNALKDQGMTMKQIAEVIGKSEGYVKNLSMDVNEVVKDDNLKNLISHAGVTLQDIGETKSITNKQERRDLLEERGKGEISRSEMRKKVKTLKESNSATKPAVAVQDRPVTSSLVNTGVITEGTAVALDTPATPATLETADTAHTQDV